MLEIREGFGYNLSKGTAYDSYDNYACVHFLVLIRGLVTRVLDRI